MKKISRSTQFLVILMPSLWLGSISLGLVNGIIGSAQAFLAINVEVSRQTINFIWASGAVGSFFAAIFTAFIFKRFLEETRLKLCFLSLNVFISGSCIASLPWLNSFSLLLVIYFCAAFTIMSFNTAQHSLIVFILGPIKSRPFLQFVDAFMASGFVLGSLLIMPFLPDSAPQSCSKLPSIDNSEDASLSWPFLIVGISHAFAALTMLFHMCSGLTMPVYHQDMEVVVDSKEVKLHQHPRMVMLLAFLFYVFSCGVEALFQSQCYTVGICGPLKMIPMVASELQTSYFLCFMIGRFSGVIISKYVHPSLIIMVSIACCLSGIILILCVGNWSVTGLFAGVGIAGFFLSFQFASGFSWLAENVDMTGGNSSIVFLGAAVGFLVSPPLAGKLAESGGGVMSVFYLMLGYAAVQALVFSALLWMVPRKEVQGEIIDS